MGLIVGAGRPAETWSGSSLWANRPYTTATGTGQQLSEPRANAMRKPAACKSWNRLTHDNVNAHASPEFLFTGVLA